MCDCGLEDLKKLVIIIGIRKTKPVEYSVQKQETLWDGGDRVEEKKRCFYVMLRHFNGEIIGRHVALVGEVEKLEHEWGERRTYRLATGTREGEHLVVYVYNPAVCENGAMHFNISTTDQAGAVQTETACVEADNCQAVFKFGWRSMQTGHATRLISGDDNYLVELRILLGAASPLE